MIVATSFPPLQAQEKSLKYLKKKGIELTGKQLCKRISNVKNAIAQKINPGETGK